MLRRLVVDTGRRVRQMGALASCTIICVGAFASSDLQSAPDVSAQLQQLDTSMSVRSAPSSKRQALFICPETTTADGGQTYCVSQQTDLANGGTQVACSALDGTITTPNGYSRCFDLAAEGIGSGGPKVASSQVIDEAIPPVMPSVWLSIHLLTGGATRSKTSSRMAT